MKVENRSCGKGRWRGRMQNVGERDGCCVTKLRDNAWKTRAVKPEISALERKWSIAVYSERSWVTFHARERLFKHKHCDAYPFREAIAWIVSLVCKQHSIVSVGSEAKELVMRGNDDSERDEVDWRNFLAGDDRWNVTSWKKERWRYVKEREEGARG